MAAPNCTISQAQKDYADKQANKALNATEASGASGKLNHLANQATAAITAPAPPPLPMQLPWQLTKKHDKIAYLRKMGHTDQQILGYLNVKPVDLNYNKKWYGSPKEPGIAFVHNLPKYVPPVPVAPIPTASFKVPPPLPPPPAPPVAKAVVFHPKDNKHDMIFKLRTAGLSDGAVIDAMTVQGYKIKGADLSWNKKYYGTTKQPASKHVTLAPGVGGSPAPTATVNPTGTLETGTLGSGGEDDADVILHKQISGPKGSNPGGVYEGSDGVKRYVKFYANETQAHVEKITNQIYNDLGLSAPKAHVFRTRDGKIAYSTRLIDGQTLQAAGLTKSRAENVLDGFAADVLTANWDAVGLQMDNILLAAGGKAIRIDNGGSLLFRAKAGLKPANALHTISEWESFANPNVNPAYAKVFKAAGLTKAEDMGDELLNQLNNIAKFHDKVAAEGGFKVWVRRIAPGLNAADADAIGQMLAIRAELLSDKALALMQSMQNAQHTGAAVATKAPANPGYKMGIAASNALAKQKLTGVISNDLNEISNYTGAGNNPVNAYLRKGGKAFGGWSKQDTEAMIARLDRVMAQAVVPADVIVYRGVDGAHELAKYANIDELRRAVGTTFVDKGFGSHSTKESVASGFGGRFVFKVRVPAGSSAAWAVPYSSHKHENELIIKRGAKYRILRVDNRHNMYGYEVEVELIGYE